MIRYFDKTKQVIAVLNEAFFKDCGTKILIGGWTELNDFFNAMRAFYLKICPK